ncbi:MHC class II transactivator isoform X3 [Hemicordylus capensis]|uniref:MHC class II transactivator isoform X3 n=1 Tax=Hemicordylus capensis TaxID=884348 RepID=UPI002304C590|nr:MHC class II transactivator isoform X3 [Hemicordylus capensis]
MRNPCLYHLDFVSNPLQTADAARMNLFKEILPRVREILSNASSYQIQMLLSLMLEEGVISKEYCQTLRQEKDRDDLARKISLNLVEKWATHLNTMPPPHCSQVGGSRMDAAAAGAKLGGLSDNIMDPGVLAGKSCLDLLDSEDDPWVLYIEEEAKFATGDPPVDTISYDQDNNPDVFYTVESDESGEEICLCSNTGEAYDKIAALADYVLKDQQENPVENLFGSLVSEEVPAECPGGCLETKKRRSCSDPPEPKRRKVAHSPALCVVNASSMAIPLNASLPGAISQSDFHVQFSVTAIGPAGRSSKAFGPSVSPSSEYFSLGTDNLHVVVTFAPLPQNAHLPIGPDTPNIDICSELIDTFREKLKNHFKDVCTLVPMERKVSMDHLYINSDLVQCHAESRSVRNANLRSCDLEEKEKIRVRRSRLFQTPGKNELGTKVIVVLGKAGMGKSLLAQKTCLDWSKGKLPEYDFVFWFDCRRLSPLLEKHCSLKQLLLEWSGGPQEEGDEVYRHILQKPDKVLLIFDSLEELKDQEGFMSCSDNPPSGLRGILAGLFQKKLLSGCTLLLLARPKDRLPQCFPRMDTALEMVGFSTQQVELYLNRYFEGSPNCSKAVSLIKDCPFLFSHCYNPEMCRFICEAVFEIEDQELPSTLSSLLVKYLLQKLTRSAKDEAAANHRDVAAVATVAWSLGQSQQNTLQSCHFPSLEVKEFALQWGLVVPFASPKCSSHEEEGRYTFSSFIVQHFLVALHLVLAQEIKDKKLTKHLRLLSKPKKLLSSWDLVPRFLAGLLFLQDNLGSSFLFEEEGEVDTEKMIAKKRKSLLKYIRKLTIRDFSPDKLLDLFHCIYETQDQYLLQHLALELQPSLSFLSFPLTLPDVHVLHSVLRRSTKEFALDLRSSIDIEGLRCLVSMKNVTSFRASLGDAVQLWKHLWEAKEGEPLRSAVEKFAVIPFKAKTMKDVEDLSALVCMQEKMTQGKADSPGSTVHVIPAIAELRRLEFVLGPVCGWKGFQKLVEILDVFPALQHLDLDSPEENEIGDQGATALSDVLPRLTSLETLNLSRNKITDQGAEKLAKALPSLPLLKTLSLYNNNIGDAGAGNIAEMLPRMSSLKVLDMQCNKITPAGAQHLTDSLKKCPRIQSVALWNPTIPCGVLAHLQQLDSRIRSL